MFNFTHHLILETQDVAIDEKMSGRVWKQHRVWRRYMVDEDDKEMEEDMLDEKLSQRRGSEV